MRLEANWYRCRDGKTRWLNGKTSLARLARAAGRKDRMRPKGLRDLLVTYAAQGIEAGTATTEGRGPQDESPVTK